MNRGTAAGFFTIVMLLPLCGNCRSGGARAAETANQPRRQDFGGLTVLDVYGSYYDMGRQQVNLLGGEARKQFEYQFAAYRKNTATFTGRTIDLMLPIAAWVESMYDDSGVIDEARGFAAGMGVSGSDGLRFLMGSLPAGSTVFAATRSATKDRGAIVGRNVDWADENGRLRPIVVRYHTNNGDLAYMTAGWALSGSGAIGINEAGFAMSFNWFPGAYQPIWGGMPKWPNRRVLQKARTVAEGIRIFQAAGYRGLAGFFTMADANGNIAMIECTNSKCAVFRPSGDWFCGTNHAQTAEMTILDKVRTPDSFQRLAACRKAAGLRAGTIDPEIAAQVLRDRSNSPYIDDSVVANPMVFLSAVVQPAARTLWISGRRQPLAPFGQMVAITFGSATLESIPAASQPTKPELNHEAELIRELRAAELLFEQRKIVNSERAYDAIADLKDKALDPNRLIWARARAEWTLGKLADADLLLAQLDRNSPFEIQVWGLAMRGVIADWQGQRDKALAMYRKAEDLLKGAPQYRLPEVAEFVSEGPKKAALGTEVPATPDLQYALDYPGTLGPVMPRIDRGYR
ncbi:MAG: C45 family autoproteolytic acyltransferase/hydrolase [Candidatus Binataceae bacterium]